MLLSCAAYGIRLYCVGPNEPHAVLTGSDDPETCPKPLFVIIGLTALRSPFGRRERSDPEPTAGETPIRTQDDTPQAKAGRGRGRAKSNGAANGAAAAAEIDLAPYVKLYREMVIIRRFEEQTERSFRRGKIGGYLHVYIGQEAIATGFLAAMRPGDKFTTSYRDHAHSLLLGADPNEVMAELYGKATGVSKGKGGSMHLFDVPRGFLGGYGIVGGHIPLSTGAAFAEAYRKTGNIAACFLGDGAMNIGAFHEPLNMAGIWAKQGLCPCLYIVENNKFAMGTALDRHSAVTELGKRFDAYGIENEVLDGQDLFKVKACADRVIAKMRQDGKPYAIEVLTDRFVGHGAADLAQPYRTKDEIETAKQRDPVLIVQERLLAAGLLDENKIREIDEQAKEIAIKSAEYADAAPHPTPDELHTDVYAPEGFQNPAGDAPRKELF